MDEVGKRRWKKRDEVGEVGGRRWMRWMEEGG